MGGILRSIPGRAATPPDVIVRLLVVGADEDVLVARGDRGWRLPSARLDDQLTPLDTCHRLAESLALEPVELQPVAVEFLSAPEGRQLAITFSAELDDDATVHPPEGRSFAMRPLESELPDSIVRVARRVLLGSTDLTYLEKTMQRR